MLACLVLVSGLTAARVASAVAQVTVVEGGPGKKPVEVPRRAVLVRPAPFRSAPARLDTHLAWLPTATPRAAPAALFLLHRALLR
jgi:hypothetical protein